MLNKFYCLKLQKYYFKKFLISQFQLKVFYFKNFNLLFLNNKSSYYIFIPYFLKIIFKNNFLYFLIKDSLYISYKKLYLFFFNLTKYIKQLTKISNITFLIKGVGLRINFLENCSSVLSLKLGYSHLIFLSYSSKFKVYILKKKIILCNYNKVLLGNFCHILYKYKPINIFTGKGLIQKKKFFQLKEYTKNI